MSSAPMFVLSFHHIVGLCNKKYERTMDQELADAAAYGVAQKMASLFCMP